MVLYYTVIINKCLKKINASRGHAKMILAYFGVICLRKKKIIF